MNAEGTYATPKAVPGAPYRVTIQAKIAGIRVVGSGAPCGGRRGSAVRARRPRSAARAGTLNPGRGGGSDGSHVAVLHQLPCIAACSTLLCASRTVQQLPCASRFVHHCRAHRNRSSLPFGPHVGAAGVGRAPARGACKHAGRGAPCCGGAPKFIARLGRPLGAKATRLEHGSIRRPSGCGPRRAQTRGVLRRSLW